MKRIVLGVVGSLLLLLAMAGSASATTFCATSTGQLSLLTSGHCSRNATTIDIPSSTDMAALTARVTTLESEVNALQSVNTTQSSQIAALQTANTGLQTLLSGVTRSGDTLAFTHMNLQLKSGSGATDGTVNGLGNLIIGYDETPGPQTGSHNLILGNQQSFTSFGGILAGRGNSITAPWASISAGTGNTASADGASVSGGAGNTASEEGASVSGGVGNISSGHFSSILGGLFVTNSSDDGTSP